MALKNGRTNGKKAYERARKNGELDNLVTAERSQTPHAVCADCGKSSGTMFKQARGKRVVNLCASCALVWQADRHADYLEPLTPAQRVARDAQARKPIAAPDPDTGARWYAGWELLNQAGYGSAQHVVYALPARCPIDETPEPPQSWNERRRADRREYMRSVAGKVRRIGTGPVMAMEAGDWESPYKPEEIERWHQKWLREMDETLRLAAAYMTADGNMSGKEKHQLNWDMTNATQRLQHCSFVLGNLLMAM